MQSRSLLLLAICAILWSCQSQATTEQATTQAAAVDTAATTVVSPEQVPATWPAKDSTLSDIPIYSTFDEIAPLFQQDNDTTYVINFWATWCKPCVKELPYFEELNASLQGQKAKVVLVSLDFPKKVATQLVPFVEKRQLSSEVLVLLDGKYNDWIDQVDPQWTGAIPATLIYKGENRRFIGQAVDSVTELQAAVKEIAEL
jgi:thiol-disulfide isomerase/thioredoxin